jgi:hypothetical protein
MPEKHELALSPLKHTWVLDFDGTLVKHNGYKNGDDEWLPGALEFLRSIPGGDYVMILTAREKEAKERTEAFIRAAGVRCNDIKFEMPMGERILLNDDKPSGLCCAHAVSLKRDQGLEHITIKIDGDL